MDSSNPNWISPEERFRLLMDAACDYAIFFLDPEGRVREWSGGAENVLGFNEQQMLGADASVIFTPEDIAAGIPAREMEVARRNGQAMDERWHVKSDGTRFFASGRLIALRDDGGALRGYAKILRDMSDRKELESLFDAFAELVPCVLWMGDSEGRCTYVNRAWTALTGLSVQQSLGSGYQQAIAPEDRTGWIARWGEAQASPGPIEARLRYLDRRGRPRWQVVRAQPLAAPRREGTRWIVAATDIHALLEARQTSEATETRWRTIFESAFEGIWILDADAIITIVNPRMAEMLGYSVEEMVGRKKWDFLFPEDFKRVRGLFEERRRGETALTEVRFRSKSGAEVWTLMSARPLMRDGKFAGALDMFSPANERRAWEQKLTASERRFRAFFELSAVGHAQVDLKTRRFVAVNRRFCEMLGYTAEELHELTIPDVTHPDDRASSDERYERLKRGELENITIEKRYVRKDGSWFWARISVAIERGEDQQPLRTITVAEDITTLKSWAAELEKRVQERTTELALKNQQLEDFCYTVAHDLRAPLRSIGGFAEFLEVDVGDQLGDQGNQYVRRIREAAARLDRLILDLLGYSRMEQVPLIPAAVDLNRVVQSVLVEVEQDVRKAEGHVEIAADLGEVQGDEGVLRHVFLNLLSNALKFRRRGVPLRIRVYSERRDDRLRVTVEDNGIGIDPRHRDKVFKMFERLNTGDYSGTGVGLAIVSKAVERLGGARGVDSVLGEGSRFWIELPAAPTAATAP